MAVGRQRAFDKQEALEAAMQVFWKKGYLGAALNDLCVAMGINKPSLYAAFGNKEALFLAATEHYLETYAKPHNQHLSAGGDVLTRLRNYMYSVVAEQCNHDQPKGCYIALCVSESASDSLPEKAEAKVSLVRDFAESHLKHWFSEERRKGNLADDHDAATLAKTVITVMHGTASMARGGATYEDLTSVVDTVLKSLEH